MAITVWIHKKNYKELIHPINGENSQLEYDYKPLPPQVQKRQSGRPKKKADEVQNPNKLKRTRLVMMCSRCGEQGHNIRSCKKSRTKICLIMVYLI